jgi:LPXTG-motif cell wall-anchored protein
MYTKRKPEDVVTAGAGRNRDWLTLAGLGAALLAGLLLSRRRDRARAGAGGPRPDGDLYYSEQLARSPAQENL